MNDITALAQRMKAAAEKAKYAGEAPVMPFDTRITALNEFQLAACPANVLALVEALEAAEQKLAEVECEMHDAKNLAEDRQLRIRDIENRQRIEYDECVLTKTRLAFDLAAANRRVAELESRTVTVKLPELCVGVVQGGHAVMVPYAAGHWFNKMAILEMLAAAGIQVIEGEQRNG